MGEMGEIRSRESFDPSTRSHVACDIRPDNASMPRLDDRRESRDQMFRDVDSCTASAASRWTRTDEIHLVMHRRQWRSMASLLLLLLLRCGDVM